MCKCNFLRSLLAQEGCHLCTQSKAKYSLHNGRRFERQPRRDTCMKKLHRHSTAARKFPGRLYFFATQPLFRQRNGISEKKLHEKKGECKPCDSVWQHHHRQPTLKKQQKRPRRKQNAIQTVSSTQVNQERGEKQRNNTGTRKPNESSPGKITKKRRGKRG